MKPTLPAMVLMLALSAAICSAASPIPGRPNFPDGFTMGNAASGEFSWFQIPGDNFDTFGFFEGGLNSRSDPAQGAESDFGACDANGCANILCFSPLSNVGEVCRVSSFTIFEADEITNGTGFGPPLFTLGASYSKLATAPAAAPGAGKCATYIVAGTTPGTCKMQLRCGTSMTPVTVIDNVGAGC